MAGSKTVHVHPSAIVETAHIGAGTRIWAFTHVLDGARIGRACNVCDHVYVEGGAVIGDRVTIKNGAIIFDGVTIEDEAFIGPGVVFTNDKWPRSPRTQAAAARYTVEEQWLSPTHVGRGATLGAGTVVLCGVTIGAYAMTGAGSVVTRNLAAYGIYAGNPARHIGYVCTCGQRLGETLVCGQCKRPYELTDQGLIEREAQPVTR